MNTDSQATPADSQPVADEQTSAAEKTSSTEAAAPVAGSPEVDATATHTEPTDSGTSSQPEAPDAASTTGNEPFNTDNEPRADAATDAPAAAATDGSSPAQTARPKIQVGSRRGKGPGDVASSKPLVARKDKPIADETAKAAEAAADSLPKSIEASVPIEQVAPVRAEVPKPSKRDPLTPEMEVELMDAMLDISLDSVVEQDATEQASKQLDLETRLPATVMRIEGDNVFFSLTGRNEGFTSIRNFKEAPEIGKQLDVVVKRFNSDDGLYEVVVPGASIDVADWSDLTEGAVVEARVSAVNTGGLECTVNNIRGFMPASQVELFRVEDFSEYLGQKMQCVVMEVNERKRNLVLSHRALLEREREESRRKLLAEISAGDVRDGVVSNIKDFGCFVDLGGVDGMIHISQLSWERVKHPSDVVEVGQKVRVKVEKINEQTGKISLSYRDLLDHPWHEIDKKFPVGTVITGPVTRIAKFGAFVRLAAGVEGLIHISELAHQRVRSVGDVVKEGEDVSVKILSIDGDEQRIALSLKATIEAPEPAADEKAEEEAPRELAVAKRKGPLKGGFDRPTGGESVGLNW